MVRQGHGRQQLLKSPCRRRRGQALIELLPALMLIYGIFFASYSFFKAMRAATIRQEVVRNLAFASIQNMGSLTTPPNYISNTISAATGGMAPAGVESVDGGRLMASGRQVPVNAGTRCFTVFPPEPQKSIATPLPSFMGIESSGGDEQEVEITTYAVVQRLPGGDCW